MVWAIVVAKPKENNCFLQIPGGAVQTKKFFFFFFAGTASRWSLGTGEAIYEPPRIFEKIENFENFIIFRSWTFRPL